MAKTALGSSHAGNHIKNWKIKEGDRPKASLLRNQSRARVDAGFIMSRSVRLAVAVATLGAWFRFVDIQRASIQILAIEAANGGNCLILCRHLDKREPFRLAAVPVSNDLDG